jgi:lipopolysaccharide export system protein LptA
VWTPKRILLLAVGFALFSAAYLVYAHFLGGINGLPPLPDDYGPIVDGPQRVVPGERENEADRKLGIAFGPDCDEVKNRNIKVELQSRGMVLATQAIKFEDGKVKFVPFSLAVFGKDRDGATFPEITTIQSREARLTFDKPVNNIAEMGSTVRKITAGELSGDIKIINNRHTPQRDDDLSLFTQGPLFYDESLHRVWTGAVVQVMDLESKPKPMEIRGTGMHLYLTADKKPSNASTAGPSRTQAGSSLRVERIQLDADVDMNLWVDARSGFLGSAQENKAPEKPATAGAKSTDPRRQGGQQSPQADKAQIKIMTQGPFRYDLFKDRATFEISHHSGPRPNVVTVDRFQEIEEKTEHLECDQLEIQFQRKNGTTAQSADDHGEGLDIETVRATGKDVILTSDAELLEAHGNDFFHDKKTHLSVLKGQPQMWALKEGNEIEAPELQLLDVKGAQQATALGAGHIRMLDKKTGERPLEAHWKNKLVYAKDGPHDLLTLTGNASFVDHEHAQKLEAQSLKVWLEPSKNSKPTAGGDTERPLPRHVDALGQVKATAPDMRVHDTDHLVIWFKDAVPSVMPPRAAPPSQGAAPGGASSTASDRGKATPVASAPGGREAIKKDPVPSDNTASPPPQPTTPSDAAGKPKKPMDMSSRFIEAHVLRTGSKNELDKLWCEGTVQIQQEPSGPDDKGVGIRGEKLQLVRQADGNILTVVGDYAQVQLDKLYIVGPEVNIDQTTNEAWVNGMGIMRLPANGNLYNTKPAQPATAKLGPPARTKLAPADELTINWEKHMYFNGKIAHFDWPSEKLLGRIVQAEQNSSHLACKAMQVTLDRKISLREGEKGKQQANVQNVVCDKDVWVEDSKRDGSRIVEYQRIDCPLLSVDNEDDKDDSVVNAGGPGTVRIFQLGTKGEILPPPGRNSAPARPEGRSTTKPLQPRSKEEGETKLTLIDYEGRMYANKRQGIARFFDKVVLIHLPSDDPNLQIDHNHLPPGYLYMSCETLEVLKSKLPDGRTYQEMRAYKKVGIEAQEFSGNADVVKYDESKEQVILEGSDGNLAILTRQKGRGTEPEEVRGKKITYLRSTGEYQVEGAQSIRVAQ